MFEILFDRLAIGVVLIDDRDRVIAANRCARSMFEARDGVVVRQGRIAAERRSEADRLNALLSAVEPWQAGTIARTGDAKPLSLVVAPVDESRDHAAVRVNRIVLLGDPERRCEVPASVLMSLYGLTHREAMLNRLLLCGGRLPEAATELGITTGTARNYLKQVFAKTETASQAELVGLLLRQIGWLDYAALAISGFRREAHGNSNHTAEGRPGRRQADANRRPRANSGKRECAPETGSGPKA